MMAAPTRSPSCTLDLGDFESHRHVGRRVGREPQERALGLDQRRAVAGLEVQPAQRLDGALGQRNVVGLEGE
ncbi:MAG: hypothetical protein IPL33_20965 [Sphingobacteriales bacterium]|nr:hypothetical protein [Sphingobacteriales bacterium]